MKTLRLYTHTHTHTRSFKEKLRENKEKGITIVSLVITIIILLILATISIQALTNTGLFESANKAKLETKRSQIKEWLSLNLMEAQTTNYNKTASEILEETRQKADSSEDLKRLGKTVNVDGELSTEEDGQTVPPYFDVIVDNDMYKVSMEEQEFIGEVGKIVPSVDFSATTTSKSITLKIITKRNQGGTVECYIKGENDSNYGTAQTATDNQYTFDNLDQGKKYSVKVVVTSRNGQKAEKEKEYTTLDIKELTTADIEFEYRINGTLINKQTWTNKEVNVMAKPKVDIAGYKIVTKKNDGTWQETDNQTLSENGIMYVALTDGRNYGSFAVGAVTNIDKTKPIITEATSTTNSISIKATDEEKGSGIVGYSITTTSSQPRSEEFTPVNNTKEFSTTINNQIQGTTYYAWVKDQAGNINEVKTVKTENVADLIKDVNVTFSYNPTGWTNGNVTVTANTTVTGYTLQTSKDGINWENAATQIFSDNGMIYARLWDGINYGGTAIGNITTIDRTVPTISDISFRGNFANTYYAICTRGTKGKVYISIDGGNTYITGNREEWIIVNYGTNYNHNLIVKLIDDAGNVSSEYTYSMTPKIVLGIQLYNGVFGRDIYVTEAEWARNYTIKDILNNIYTSTECEQKNPDNISKVYALYRGIMGREPDSSGYQAHLAGLNNGNTLQYYATSVFLYSQEFKAYLSNNGLTTTD